ncbi:hypothetical protein [Mycobacterium deserti]|uniref:Secreted protein n=1 Tax=Mycobacterium deserti TaxID=2978347 RepID=A0ABT2MA15_9MYCO|nr:hypothetical protein [Mycobacterium deserti]MCT7659119.1 hypothetical protein [Mycobacterium deserti]
MTTRTPTVIRLARYLAGPALALGLAIGSAAAADAVWDIGGYDRCMSQEPRNGTSEETLEWWRLCCVNSGGVWKPGPGSAGCYAPGVDSQGRNPLTGAPTHVMQPSPLPGPPGDIGQAPGGVVTSSP